MSQPERKMGSYPYTDVVDFVERTTYVIWNDKQPDLVHEWYLPETVIWTDGGDIVGADKVTADTGERRRGFSDYYGVIDDTIWTGDDQSGYRTSMRWIARGTHDGESRLGEPSGRSVANSSISHCVIRGDQYIEEWAGRNSLRFFEQLGMDVETAAQRIRPTGAPRGEKARETTRALGVTVPAIPKVIDGPGRVVVDLLNGLYNDRDLSWADRSYAPGAPYSFSTSRIGFGPAGARAEVERWLSLLPDLKLEIEELYWNLDGEDSGRVAVRYQIEGTAQDNAGQPRPVSMMGFHHIHVHGTTVVAEWAEYNELALLAQVGK
ncbi:MAG: ester cyclase [Homoserinimonas sp.]